jgi:hypothetical protein
MDSALWTLRFIDKQRPLAAKNLQQTAADFMEKTLRPALIPGWQCKG